MGIDKGNLLLIVYHYGHWWCRTVVDYDRGYILTSSSHGVCVCVCFLPIHSGHQVRWTYQPGSHRRKVTQDF